MRKNRGCAAAVLAAIALLGPGEVKLFAAEPTALPRAHAHNDYHHPRPLLDALDQGFCSVEADILFVGGKLLVGHGLTEVRPDRTLEALYLEPLRARVKANGGKVHPDAERFFLLIDIKTAGPASYAALQAVLANYAEMLTTVRDGKVEPGAVTVVVSGNRPIEAFEDDRLRFAGYDGRLADLDADQIPPHRLPMISDHWGSAFRWRGVGPMPDAEKAKLRDIVDRAHRQGRVVRFWAAPDRPEVWRALYEADVDLINTDNLAGLAAFLREQSG